jgi:hypothetical protein
MIPAAVRPGEELTSHTRVVPSSGLAELHILPPSYLHGKGKFSFTFLERHSVKMM